MQFIQTVSDLNQYLSTLPRPPVEYKIAMGALIFTSDDKVILIERGEGARDATGKREGVGGGLEEGETDLIAALRREIDEEIGVKVEIDATLIVKVMTGEHNQLWVVVDYLARLSSGTPHIHEPAKIRNIYFSRLSEIEENLLSEYQKVTMKAYRKKYGEVPFYKIATPQH
ncbi:NUDIX hydrolase [Candidatus Roizmanbacteria bacterium]|nr:NUDIX hydrolase [Candidatus Roizmanbacteria bacterium]